MLLKILEEEQKAENTKDLSLFKEMAINFENGEVITKNGEIIILEGEEALNIWIWKALKTERNRFKAYSGNFGSDIYKEIGYVYDRTIKEQLMINEIIDTLLVNPYITNVYDFDMLYSDETLSLNINFKVDSIYGTATQEVLDIGY